MARRGGGFPGMGGGMNPQQMMMKVQKMQQQMAQAQEEIANTEITASAGGGMVTVKMTGGYKMVAVEIKPEAVDPDDVEMLQDMVMAAMNGRCSRWRNSRKRRWALFPAACPDSFSRWRSSLSRWRG